MNKKICYLAAAILGIFMFSCSEDDPEVFSATIHVSVMFMPMNDMAYTTDSDATMIMAYLWEGDSWTAAKEAGPIDAMGEMFGAAVSAGGTELAGTYEKEISISAAGTYYLGVFETSGMAYSNVVDTVGYYEEGAYTVMMSDTTVTNVNMMMPLGISVTTSGDYDLKTMMAMKMAMGGM